MHNHPRAHQASNLECQQVEEEWRFQLNVEVTEDTSIDQGLTPQTADDGSRSFCMPSNC